MLNIFCSALCLLRSSLFSSCRTTVGGSTRPVDLTTVLTGRTEVARTHPAFSINPRSLVVVVVVVVVCAVQALRAASESEVRLEFLLPKHEGLNLQLGNGNEALMTRSDLYCLQPTTQLAEGLWVN